MGSLLTKISNLFYGSKQYRILMVGLDGAGKSTTLYKLQLGETVHTVPTIGFNVEEVTHGNVTLTIWDVGGQNKIRPLWKHYYHNAEGIIFVVDSADETRFSEAAHEMKCLLEEEKLKNTTFLVMANKQDLPQAQSVLEMKNALHLTTEIKQQWHIQECSATQGQGIYEGLQWLIDTLNMKKPTETHA